MTFGEACALFAAGLRPDGDSIVTIPLAAPWHSTPFGSYVKLALRAFSKETCLFFARRSVFAFETGDQDLDLSDGSRGADLIYEPWSIWLGTTALGRAEAQAVTEQTWFDDSVGAPTSWVRLMDGKVSFNRPFVEDTSGYVRGLRYHKPIVDDDTVLEVPDEYVLLLKPFVETILREDVAGDEVGAARLQRFDSRAAIAIRTLRGQQMATLLNDDTDADLGTFWYR